MKAIKIHQASLHNLKNIDVEIPLNKLVAVTGVSGSGKSTLVFDILFDAGRKRYLQAIGALANLGEESGYDQIDGLRPAVAIKQGIVRQSNPRSVVGTKTRILNYLGTLYADTANRRQSDISAHSASTPAHFSFNSPMGMCLQCQGRGHEAVLDLNVLLPHKNTTVAQFYENAGCATTFRKRQQRMQEKYNFSETTAFRDLSEAIQNLILYGQNPDGAKRTGVFDILQYRLRKAKDTSNAITVKTCDSCHGYRVGDEARSVKIGGRHIGQLGLMTILQLDAFLQKLTHRQTSSAKQSGLNELTLKRLSTVVAQLVSVKLGYLTLYRPIPTLSGGESQRLFLMSSLSADIESLLYIFDEPTAGLHEIEKQQLLDSLRALRQQGNALVIVEHDAQSIAAAEHVIDIGPLAGHQGGEIVFAGTYKGLLRCPTSITGQYLSGRKKLPGRAPRPAINRATPKLRLSGIKTNNLKSATLTIPLARMVGIAGVSGSGKSSLVADTLVPVLRTCFRKQGATSSEPPPAEIQLNRPTPVFKELLGIENLSRVVEVSQAPIGRRSNSNAATYLGIWDRIRRCYASQSLAKKRHYDASHFSFNAQGACEHCQGSGQHRMWLGSTFVSYQCDRCRGLRYQSEILDVRYRDLNITELLQLPTSDVKALFEQDKVVYRMLDVLDRTGMGYVSLGQPTNTLSGGEAQRIKLAREIGRRHNSGPTLFVMDEPTTGLSLYDTARLLELLNELVHQNHSVIVIEHDPEVLSHCDWIVEVGPGSGHLGGRIIANGTPSDLKAKATSLIGPFLSQ